MPEQHQIKSAPFGGATVARGIRRKLIVAVIAAAADAANSPLLRFGNLNVHYQRALFALFVAHLILQLPSKILQNRRGAAGLMAGFMAVRNGGRRGGGGVLG